MDRYRIFLSSPTDVQLERDRAEIVVRKLNAERVDRPQLELIRWEDAYYVAESSFQEQITKPADCDLVVCLFWKRLGSELPPRFQRPDGTTPTGTEYEFENAMQAAIVRPQKLPDVLVYRKTAEVTFSADKLELERAQYERFMAFWQRWFRNETGHFVAGFQTFEGPDRFEALFERNLRSWLANREVDVAWTKGSPYRGLEPFDVEHAPIFFGRRRETERARARLVASAMAGLPFLLISGASGSGKSSLARAGLIPRLSQVGGLSTLASSMRYTILTPGQIAADWSSGLAGALLEPHAIAAGLGKGDFATRAALAAQLTRGDAAALAPLTRALEREGAAIAEAEQRTEAPSVVLLLLIDQLEEIFAWPKDRAQAFLGLLAEMVRLPGAPIWVVATMRSDFQHRLADFPALERLAGRLEVRGPGDPERTLELGLPSLADLREMIRHPARAAGLTFETSDDGTRDLDDLIETEALPEAMPAIQFLLSELYNRREGNTLLLAAYDALGGIAGVMAARGEEVYRSVDSAARGAFPRIVRALVTQTRPDVPASIRRVAESALARDEPAARLVGALKDTRLVISDRGEVRFAHDTLLKGWKRLGDQIGEERRLFEARDRLEQLCRRWIEARKTSATPEQMLLQGFQLAEGRELIAKWGPESLKDKQPELPAYIAASDAREKRARRIALAVGWSVASVFAVLSVLLFNQWRISDAARRAEEIARKDAQAALWVANARTDLREGRVGSAVEEATRAYALRPSETTRSALGAAILEVSPHLLATHATGTSPAEAITWTGPGVLAAATVDAGIVARPALQPDASPTGRWPLARLLRSQDGNRASVKALVTLADGRRLAVHDEGSIVLTGPDTSAETVRTLTDPASLYHTPHAVAVGATGKLVAMTGAEGEIIIVACAPGEGTVWLTGCSERRIPQIRGRAVAISPDETRIAVAGEDGRLTVHARNGQAEGAPIDLGGPPISVAWAGKGDWIAVGRGDGEVMMIGGAAAGRAIVGKANITGAVVSALAFAPDVPDLAFVCDRDGDRIGVCLWPAAAGGGQAPWSAPIVRFTGHAGNAVTALGWSPDGALLASAGSDRTVRVWSRTQSREAGFALYADTPAALHPIATSADGRWIAAGDRDGTLRLWDVASGRLVRVARAQQPSETVALAWSAAGLLAAQDERGVVTLLSADPAVTVRRITFETGLGTRLAFAEDGRTLATPEGGGRSVVLLDAAAAGAQSAPRRLPALAGDLDPWGVATDPTGRQLYVMYTGGELRVWDLAAGTASPAFAHDLSVPRDPAGARSLSLTPDGRYLATSGGDGFVRVYDTVARKAIHALPIEASEPRAVAFSPDGRRLAALGVDQRITIWDWNPVAPARHAVLVSLASRATIAGVDRSGEEASWITWVGNGAIAVASGSSALGVIGLDDRGWAARRKAVAPTSSSSVK